MKILILGAGQVGSSVAESLAGEANDITVVDSNASALRHLQEHFDLRTLTGFASHPDVLRRAGAENADMLLAVTNSDETNMIACQVAHHLFGTPTRIARVRARSYLSQSSLFNPGCLAIDELISPEQVVTDHIERIIEHPGTLQVLDFAGGIVLMVAVRAFHGGPLVGHALRTLSAHLPTVDARVAVHLSARPRHHPRRRHGHRGRRRSVLRRRPQGHPERPRGAAQQREPGPHGDARGRGATSGGGWPRPSSPAIA